MDQEANSQGTEIEPEIDDAATKIAAKNNAKMALDEDALRKEFEDQHGLDLTTAHDTVVKATTEVINADEKAEGRLEKALVQMHRLCRLLFAATEDAREAFLKLHHADGSPSIETAVAKIAVPFTERRRKRSDINRDKNYLKLMRDYPTDEKEALAELRREVPFSKKKKFGGIAKLKRQFQQQRAAIAETVEGKAKVSTRDDNKRSKDRDLIQSLFERLMNGEQKAKVAEAEKAAYQESGFVLALVRPGDGDRNREVVVLPVLPADAAAQVLRLTKSL